MKFFFKRLSKRKTASLFFVTFAFFIPMLFFTGCGKDTHSYFYNTSKGAFSIETPKSLKLTENDSYNGFGIFNKSGEKTLSVTIVGRNQIVPSTCQEVEIGGRTCFFYKEGEMLNYLSYLGDIGVDCGVLFQTKDVNNILDIKLGMIDNVKPIAGRDERSYFSNISEGIYPLTKETNGYFFPDGTCFFASNDWESKRNVGKIDHLCNSANFYRFSKDSVVLLYTSNESKFERALEKEKSISKEKNIEPFLAEGEKCVYVHGKLGDWYSITFLSEINQSIYVMKFLSKNYDDAANIAYELAGVMFEINKNGYNEVDEEYFYDSSSNFALGSGSRSMVFGKLSQNSNNQNQIEVADKKYWEKPEGFDEAYKCEYFESYRNEELEVTLYYKMSSTFYNALVDNITDLPDNSDFEEKKKVTVNGQVYRVFDVYSKNDGVEIHTYHCFSDEENRYITVNSVDYDELVEEDIRCLLPLFF